MRFAIVWVWLVGALLGAAPAWQAELDAAIAKAMEQQKVPGLALGVIQNGQVIMAKGYGVRDLVSRRAVTEKTLFGMGSVTKSFTAAVVAAVIADGKLEWDKPVREYLPWFRMYDPVATELITVRDMLTHRSGLPRHDFIRFSTYLSREELVRRVRYLEPNKTFRDVYQYNNLMFVTAGYLAGVMAGSTWEDLVRDRVFVPVGMSRSNTSTRESVKADDFAKPHEQGKETEFYYYQQFGVGPNGAVNSTVEDMLKYLQMWLDKGKANGKQVLPGEQVAEVFRPVSVVNSTAMYAPGWQVGTHRGHRSISHGGAITGFRAHMILLPEEKAGVVAMINDESGLAGDAAMLAADYVLGVKARDITRIGLGGGGRRMGPEPVAGTRPSKGLGEYAGVYRHPAYGNVRVEERDGGLEVKFDAVTLRLKHFHYDMFSTSMGMARFVLDERGRVREMHLPLEAAVKALVFMRE
ncbi:MAG: serine hydrolase [Acidobacteria bacterium]|nr:serine hydrolase [Acidobacteriota bacterium]